MKKLSKYNTNTNTNMFYSVGIIGLRVGIGLTTFLDRNVVPGSTKYVDPGTWKHHSDMFICKSLFILSCTINYFYN